MGKAKKRINITVDDGVYGELEALKKLKGAASLTAVVLELTKDALETQEDLYFAKIADDRKNEKPIAHARLWKK
jgi:predicted CopG family antitoxin